MINRCHSLLLCCLIPSLLFAACDDGSAPCDVECGPFDASLCRDGGDGDAAEAGPAPCQGCQLGLLCYPNGVTHPENACLICDVSRSADEWTENEGAICNDERFCTIEDRCVGSDCQGVPRTCADQVSCNGEEWCSELEERCMPGESTCGPRQVCDPTTDACLSFCSGCVIDGVCYGDGQMNPLEPCQVCDIESTSEGWSNADGLACDDDVFCNGRDSCHDGSCSEHSGSPCEGDGLFCNGAESCDESADRCVSSGNPCVDDGLFCNGVEVCDETADTCSSRGNPCPAGQSCDEEDDRCCRDESFLACNGDGDVALFDPCSVELTVVEICPDTLHSTCRAGICACESSWTGEGCERCLRYVNGATGDDSNDGTSWAQATASLQAALDLANPLECEVWVAAGTYFPSLTGSREERLQVNSGVAVYGGFWGNEILRNQRSINDHPTILSGDIGVVGDPTDNSYRLINTSEGSVLDGFTLEAAHSTRISSADSALNMVGSTVRNCQFRNNSAADNGSALWITGRTGLENHVWNCTFEDNISGADGGALYFTGAGELFLWNCEFYRNRSAGYGGAIWANHSFEIINSNFFGNAADIAGGALYGNPGSSPQRTVTNSIIWGNMAPLEPQFGGEVTLRYCDVEGAGFDGADGNISSDPLFVNTDPTAGAMDLGLQSGSPCIDRGDDTVAPELDMDGLPRQDIPTVSNCESSSLPDCSWISDIGAHEYQPL